jgi:hypothetical protein
MYIIVTTNKALAEEARKRGANVYEDAQLAQPTTKFESAEYGEGEMRVINLMQSLAIKPNLKGYDYIKSIMTKCAIDSKYHKKSMTKVIYPECAREFDTTTSRVERAVRHALERSFEEVPERYFQIFKRELDGQPTNSEFISMMSEFLHRPATAAV